ncbi:MAG: AAA family ATPase [Candidatus Omnitrophota bacterium]
MYYKVLGLEKEPFSTSPDPEFFYLSREHELALTNTLIELHLKRGLTVILGDVGTGKTTLSRKLIQELKERDEFVLYIVLNPSFENEHAFFTTLARGFDINPPNYAAMSAMEISESVERFLFQKGIAEGKTVTLIIDEAQKLSDMSLECLRLLLNYETNEFKLLQLVLLGQVELYGRIKSIPNFYDRISFRYTLNPLGYEETKEMIEFRIRQAGFKVHTHLFLDEAIKEIYRYSGGYPRKITMLCHKLLKEMVMRSKFVVDKHSVEKMMANEEYPGCFKEDILLQKNNY